MQLQASPGQPETLRGLKNSGERLLHVHPFRARAELDSLGLGIQRRLPR